MARYVLLSFDDNDQAETFVAAVTVPGGVIFVQKKVQDSIAYGEMPTDVFVRGLYMKPTQFCDCREKGNWGKDDGWSRGKKYGLYVHSRCGKPGKAWAAGDHWYATLGKNLLPVTPEAPEWRGEGIAHHRFDSDTKQWVHVETGEPWDLKTKQGH